MPPTMPPLRSEPRRRRLISLAPLIDVVFILLVFFMLATSFADWRALPLEVPAAGPGAAGAEALVIDVTPAEFRTGGVAQPLDAVIAATARLAAARPERPVFVRAMDGAALQRVVSVIDRLSAAGVMRVSLIAGSQP